MVLTVNKPDVRRFIAWIESADWSPCDSREKLFIFGAAFTVVSCLFSAWRFYKDYKFKNNLKRALHYILDENSQFRYGIFSNKRNLFSLSVITSSNCKEVRTDLADLRSYTDTKFDYYIRHVMHTAHDTVFYKNYMLIMWILLIRSIMTTMINWKEQNLWCTPNVELLYLVYTYKPAIEFQNLYYMLIYYLTYCMVL